MVWPFSSSSSQDNNADPYSKLDPSLRKFLDRESAAKYNPSTPPERPVTAREQANLTTEPEKTPIPTLYPDGRYEHLWKNYRSRAVIESEHRSDQEKLSDVLRSYKDRKSSISSAALENCAAVNAELDLCYRKPTLSQRVTMCRDHVRALDRCLTLNKQFLSALGYLSSPGRSHEEEEAIQMHADKLYTNMLQKEKEINEARAQGREVPDMSTVFDDNRRPPELDHLTEKGRQQLEERTKGMTPAEKDLEERAFAGEIRAGTDTIARLEQHRAEVRQARIERIESGKARTFDGLHKWLGW